MRTFILTLIAVITLTTSIHADVMAKVQSSGELVLGTSGTMTPMTRKLDNGSAVGFDIDLAKVMAKAMNAKLVIKVIPFNELIPALEKGDIDFIISNMTITPERNMKVSFVGPYMTSGKCIVTKLNTLANSKKAQDIAQEAKTIAVVKDTTSEQFVKGLMPDVKRTTVNNQDEAVALVSEGEVQAFISDYPVCMSIIQSNPDAGFISIFSKLTYEPIGIAVPANDTHFINWTEKFLERATETRLLNVLGNKWLGEAKL